MIPLKKVVIKTTRNYQKNVVWACRKMNERRINILFYNSVTQKAPRNTAENIERLIFNMVENYNNRHIFEYSHKHTHTHTHTKPYMYVCVFPNSVEIYVLFENHSR